MAGFFKSWISGIVRLNVSIRPFSDLWTVHSVLSCENGGGGGGGGEGGVMSICVCMYKDTAAQINSGQINHY